MGGIGGDYAPTIILNPGDPGPLEVNLGEELYSRCVVLEADRYAYKWIQRFPDGTVKEIAPNERLYISSVGYNDLQYPLACQVTRADGAVFEKVLNVRLANLEDGQSFKEPTLTIRPLPNEDLQGGSVMRQCLFEGNQTENDLYDFRWIDQHGRVVTNGDKLYLLLADPVELGNYTCEATNRQTGVIYQARYRISRPVVPEASQHYVIVRPITSAVVLGRPYEMTCEVEPLPREPITYRWYYNNRMVGTGPHLRLDSLSFSEIGNYVCNVEWTPQYSRTGSMAENATVELNLALTAEPSIEMSPPPGSAMVSLLKETRELHCELSRAGQGPINWYFNNQPLEHHPTLNQSGRVQRLDRTRVSIIVLRGVEPAHQGTYECRVGSEVKQTHLIVRSEEGLEVNPATDTVEEGASVEFHCRVHGLEGSLNREIEWYYKPFYSTNIVRLDTETSEGFMRQDDPRTPHTSFISRVNARLSDQGEYICRLRSLNKEARGKLFVRAGRRYVVSITPSIIKVRTNQPVELECYVRDESGRPVTITPRYRTRDQRVRYDVEQVSENRARFIIRSGLTTSQNGTVVECFTDEPGNVAVATIIVEDTCPPGSRRCRTGQCLLAGRFCDGIRDCDDGSDEDPRMCSICDPISKKCEYYQGRAPSKSTYMIHWSCDGEDDCGNGYDEADCEGRRTERCQDQYLTCGRDNRRIPMAFVCDDDRDCPYGEDEQSCSRPIIAEPRTTRYSVRTGGQVVLRCEVSGNPVPYVIWRFNWGCLSDEPNRFDVKNVAQNCNSPIPTVISTLTISNIRPGDDGIYNCEGLVGSSRALSNDYFVMLEN